MATVTSVSVLSNNVTSNSRATTNNVITIVVNFNSHSGTAVTGTVNLGSVITFANTSGNTYQGTYSVGINDTQGVAAIAINFEATVYNVPSIQSVTIDTAGPIAQIVYTTTGSSLSIPAIGDVHTISVIVNETLLSYPRLSFGAESFSQFNTAQKAVHPVFKWVQTGGLTWQATYTVVGNEILPRGLIFNFTDLTGNISIIPFNLLESSFFDFSNNFYYFDHFFNQTKGRYYSVNGADISFVPPINVDETGIARFHLTQAGDYAGYNISTNYNTFLYQSYTTSFETTLKISDLTDQAVATSAYTIRFGFFDDDSATPLYGIYFETSPTSPTSWNTCTALNGTIVKNSPVSPENITKISGVNARYLKITYSGATAQFYIDNVLVDSIAYDVPDPITTGVFPSLGVYISQTTLKDVELKCDYIELIMNKNQEGDYNDDFSFDFNI